MRYPLILVICFLNCLILKAQQFSHAYSFFDTISTGSGIKGRKCLIDKNDNVYTQLLTQNGDFFIDSAGFLIKVNGFRQPFGRNFDIILTKHKPNGVYDYYSKITYLRTKNNFVNTTVTDAITSISIDNNNEIIGAITIDASDSVILENANKTAFHTFYNKDSLNTFLVLFKMNAQGNFLWANSLTFKKRYTNKLSLFDLLFRGVSITPNNEIITSIDFNKLNPPLNDTIVLTTHTNQSSFVFVNQFDLNLKFSPTGSLLNQYPSFRLKNQFRSNATELIKSVSRNNITFQLLTIKLATKDTLLFDQQQLALDTGTNLLLIKRTQNDSIEWAKLIGRGSLSQYPSFDIDAQMGFNKVLIGVGFIPGKFLFNNPVNIPSIYLSQNASILYLAQFDLVGNFINAQISGATSSINIIETLTINPITGYIDLLNFCQWTLPVMSDFYIGKLKYVFNNFETQLLMAQLAPTLEGIEIRVFSKRLDFVSLGESNPGNSGSNINQDTLQLRNFGIGTSNFDSKGRMYLPGTVGRKLFINCKDSLTSQLFTIGGNGFLLISKLPRKIIDTLVCNKMISPSRKYTWDSSGFYYDTIPDFKGCDSLLLIQLKVLNTQKSFDTAVCYMYKSPSGKYNWDSTGIYKDTIPNISKCDSIITINLKVKATRKTIDTAVCTIYKSPSGKYTWNASGVYLDTIPNAANCDSIITIRLNVLQSTSTLDTAYCGTYISPSGKLLLSVSGIVNDTIPNAKGCDSIVSIRFTKLWLTDTIQVNQCGKYTSPSGKYEYSLTGVYADTLYSNAQCDSIITIQFTQGISQSNITINDCDSNVSPSGKYIFYSSGLYEDTLKTQLGCDSLITINLTIIPLVITLTKSNNISCDSLTAQLSTNKGYTYLWSPVSFLNNSQIAAPIALPMETTWYSVLVKDTLGCSVFDSIQVLVNKQETIKPLANVFTPNGDNKNDCLALNSVANFKEVSFLIYNRWGALVFSTTNPIACWDGKDQQNQEVSEGVYLFIIKGKTECDTLINQKGSVQLMR